MSGPRYAELQVTSHFSFLHGASSAAESEASAVVAADVVGIASGNLIASLNLRVSV